MLKRYFSLLLLMSSFIVADMCQSNDMCCNKSMQAGCSSDMCLDENACPCNKPPTKDSLATQDCPCNKPPTKDALENNDEKQDRCSSCSKPPRRDIDTNLLETLRKNAAIESFYVALTEQEQSDFVALVNEFSKLVQQYDATGSIANCEDCLSKVQEKLAADVFMVKIYDQNIWPIVEQEIRAYGKNQTQE